MAKRYYFGLDVGTSGLKTLLMDSKGNIIAVNNQDYPIYSPKPLWSEQNPLDWWKAVVKGIRKAISDSMVKPSEIAGLGLSGQMHGSVFLADDNKPLRSAILWNDQRTAKECEYIEKAAGGRKKLIQMVANPAITGFTAPKIIWVRNNEPAVFKKTRHVLLPKDYIRLLLTGDYATEVSDASGTLLFDVKNRKWHTGLIDKLGLDKNWFPKCYESSEITGYVTSSAAKETGLPEGVPVVGGGGDQAAGAVGSGIVSSGIISATMGTSGVVFAYSDKPEFDPLGRIHTMCHAVSGKWCMFGCALSAGGSFQWFRNHFGAQEMAEAKKLKKDPYELLIDQAKKAPAGSEGLFFLPYLTGERTPHADPFARGCFIGITARTTRNEMIRSVIEGITFALRDQIQIMRSLDVKINQVRSSGGGARSGFWRKLQADMYNAPVVTINTSEGAALGVAILAAVGTGEFSSVPQACQSIIRTVSKVKPEKSLVKLYSDHHAVFQKLYADLKHEFPILAKM
jgi:xylulokinase